MDRNQQKYQQLTPVCVECKPGKSPYLRTHADGKWNDNLLALTECVAVPADWCNIISHGLASS
jgi:hypothetical protein